MRFVSPFGNNIIHFLRSKGGKECRQGSDEARRIESILVEIRTKEDGTREEVLRFRIGSVAEGEDQDSPLGGDRESA